MIGRKLGDGDDGPSCSTYLDEHGDALREMFDAEEATGDNLNDAYAKIVDNALR